MKKFSTFLFSIVILVSLLSCGSNNKDEKGIADNTPVLVQAEITGGCNITLLTPRPGETIDLRNGRSYEFAWTTNGTYCETPYQLYIAGNPANLQTGENIYSWSLSESSGQISKTGGGFRYFTSQDFEGIISNDGTHHWVTVGYHGSHPASQSFKVIR